MRLDPSVYPDLLLSAWKMNEYMPMFLVQHLKQRSPIFERRCRHFGVGHIASCSSRQPSW